MADVFTSSLSFFGRVVDSLSRAPLLESDYRVSVLSPRSDALAKRDGFFAFQGLKPLATPYSFRLTGARYQRKEFQGTLTAPPVELAFPEDELVVSVKAADAKAKAITFDKIPFLPPIPSGAPVRGEGGFSSTLKTDLGGVDVQVATLDSVAGLAAGTLLRIARSRALVVKPGPSYPFPAGLTLISLTVVEDLPGEPPVSEAKVQLTKLEGVAPAGTQVGGVEIQSVTLPGPGGPRLVLGQAQDLTSLTDDRGRAVLFFPGQWPLTQLQVELTHPGHAAKTQGVTFTAGQRTATKIKLAPA